MIRSTIKAQNHYITPRYSALTLHSHAHPLASLTNLTTTNLFSLYFFWLVLSQLIHSLQDNAPLTAWHRLTTCIAQPLVHHWAVIMLREVRHLISLDYVGNACIGRLASASSGPGPGYSLDSAPACLPCLTLLRVENLCCVREQSKLTAALGLHIFSLSITDPLIT